MYTNPSSTSSLHDKYSHTWLELISTFGTLVCNDCGTSIAVPPGNSLTFTLSYEMEPGSDMCKLVFISFIPIITYCYSKPHSSLFSNYVFAPLIFHDITFIFHFVVGLKEKKVNRQIKIACAVKEVPGLEGHQTTRVTCSADIHGPLVSICMSGTTFNHRNWTKYGS